MAGVPFISVHVSRQLDNQPLQWKSIVLIGLYLLYNSPAGNPWWQIISAPVFDWCFDVSDLQGQTEELVEALLTESNPALSPRLTPAQSPDLLSDGATAGGRAVQKKKMPRRLRSYSAGRPTSSQRGMQAGCSEGWLAVKVTVCLMCLDLKNTHTHAHASASVTQ